MSNIATKMTALETVQAFCSAWFEERNADKAHFFLAPDEVCFVGTGEDEFAYSSEEMKEYLIRDVQEIPEPFSFELMLFQEQVIGERTRNISIGITLKNTKYSWRLRAFFTLVRIHEHWRFRTLWFAEPGNSQRGEEHYPRALVMENIARQRQAQAEVMHLYNNVPGAVFRVRFDEGFSVADANDGLYEFLGYTREEFGALGNQMAAVIYPGDLEAVRARLIAGGGRGETIRDEHRLVCKDGSIKWVSLKAQLLSGDDGNQYFYGVFVDITEEKLSQERVRELYEKELAYFAQTSSAEGSIQGKVNVTKEMGES